MRVSNSMTLRLTLRVTDAAGLYDEDQVVVTVSGPPEPTSVTISADATPVPEGSAAV